MTNNVRLTIIIVDFFKAKRVVENVRSILSQHCDFDFKIVVVDNSAERKNRSILKQLDDCKRVRLIFNNKNRGYTAACNQAAKNAQGNYFFLVNPDIRWTDRKILQKTVDFMNSNQDVGILGPRQVNDDGSTPQIVRKFPSLPVMAARWTPLRKLPLVSRLVSAYEMSDFDYHKPQCVDWIQSSFLVIRKDFWQKTGGLDEGYFLFMSDPDICFKAWESGMKVFYFPGVTVAADGKRCSTGESLNLFKNPPLRHHIRDAVRYQIRYLFKNKTKLRRNEGWTRFRRS
jgi:N-acetylglucosaminyl-diphospho-decaprenol L-rhamnosyltransferase